MNRWLLDFDSVSADLGAGQVKSCNEKFGTSYTVEDIVTWIWWANNTPPEHGAYVWGDEVFKSREWTLSLPPMAGAIESIGALMDQGDEFYVVSDRKPYMADWLHDWFWQQGLMPHGIQVTSREGYTKLDATRHLGLNIAIDDAEHNVVEFVNSGYFDVVYLLDRPWNRQVECDGIELVRAQDWSEVVSHYFTWVSDLPLLTPA